MARSCADCTYCRLNLSEAFDVPYRHEWVTEIGKAIKRGVDVKIQWRFLNEGTGHKIRCSQGQWKDYHGKEKQYASFWMLRQAMEGNRRFSGVIKMLQKAQSCEFYEEADVWKEAFDLLRKVFGYTDDVK